MDVFTPIEMTDHTTQVFYAIVNSKSLKTDILLVVERKTTKMEKQLNV